MEFSVDNKLKEYMNRLRDSASHLLSDKREDEALVIEVELEPREYERLQERAEECRTTAKELANEAVREFLDRDAAFLPEEEPISEERKRSNPLLALAGIARHSH